MKNFIIFSLISMSVFAQKSKSKPTNTKWSSLMKLINQEIATIHNARKKTSPLKYRLLELQSEKLKLWKQKENTRFMQMSLKGKKITRKKAFSKTLSLYEKTRRQGLAILKKHPKTQYRAAIYYTLALNSRDYAYDDKEYRYLRSALALSPKESEIQYLSRTSLAEYFYNKKKYKKAVNLYNKVTKNVNDEWHTKNLYNYGWCLLKTHKFEKAITTLESAYALSADGFYIDFRSQIMEGLVNFYVLGKQIERGKNFILGKVENKYEALFKYAKKVANKGYKKEALELIQLTEQYIDPKMKNIQLADLRLFQFDFYKQFNDKDKMHEMALNLSLLKLTEEQMEDITYKVSEEVGAQQLILKNEYNKEDGIYTHSRLSTIISYFKLLSQFDKKNDAKYLYYSAETLYTVAEFKKALTYYKESVETQIKSKSDLDLNEKALDSIFSCIELGKYSQVERQAHLEYAYNKNIALWPKSKKSLAIYPKLFALYLFSKRYNKSQASIDLFHKNFPKKIKEQRGLFNQQIDFFIKKQEINLIAQKVNLMYKGYLSFTFKQTKKTEKILADILFQKYQKLKVAGKKNEALKGYREIFYKAQYPKSVRADAAFNMGIIYIDLYDSAQGVKWFKKAIPFFTKKEKAQRRIFLEKVSLRSSLLQDFLNAANIQKIVLQIYCSGDKKKNLDSFNKAISYDLANDYITKALYTYKTYAKCTSKDLKWANGYIISHLYNNNHENTLLSFSRRPQVKSQFKEQLGSYFEQLYWKYSDKDYRKASRFKKRVISSDCTNCKLFVKSFKDYKVFKKAVKKHLSQQIVTAKKFDGNKFNDKLSRRLTSLKPVLKQGDDVLANAHPEISLLTYDLITTYIESFSKQIEEIEVSVKDEKFQKQFKSQMLSLSLQVKAQAKSYIKRANTFIDKNSILSMKQKRTHPGFEILNIGDTRAPAGTMLSTLDL